MAILSDFLIDEFVKLTTPEKPKKSEAIVYGTVSKIENDTYIKIDGSDIITPASSVTVVSDGDRVTAMVKNHSVVITGNITKPSAQEAQVEEASSNAAKTATNYIGFESGDGLTIGNLVSQELGYNIKIDADKIQIRDKYSTISEYGATIRLGLESSHHTLINNQGISILNGDSVSIASFDTDNSSNPIIRLGSENGDNTIVNSNGMSINRGGLMTASFGDEIHLYKNGYSIFNVEGSSKISNLISNYRYISCSSIHNPLVPRFGRIDNVEFAPETLFSNTEYLVKTDVTEERLSGASAVTNYLNYIIRIGPTDIQTPSKFTISFFTPSVIKITGSNGTFPCLFYNLAESYSNDRVDLIRYDNRSYIEGSFRTKYDSGDLISQSIDTDESLIIGCDKQDQLCINPRSIGSRSYDKTENGYDKFIPNELTLNPEGGQITIHGRVGYDTSSTAGFIPKTLVIDEDSINVYQKDFSFIKYTGGTNTISLSIDNSGMESSGIKYTARHDDMPYTHVHSNSNNSISFGIGSGGIDRGIYDNIENRWIINNDVFNNLNLATHDSINFNSDANTGYTTIKSFHSSGMKRPLCFDPPVVFSDQLAVTGPVAISSGVIGNLSELSLKLSGMSSSEKPYFTKTDTININDFRSSGYSSVSNSIPRINFVVPIDRPMVNISSVSISNTSGFKLIQNGKYVLGSSSNTFILSSSIIGYKITGSCVRIYASFEDADLTGFTVNDTIAVEWNGTITFS